MKNSFAKILSLVLALIMLISVVPSAALARNVGTGETNVLTGWFDWWRDFLNPRPRPNPGYPAQSLEAKPVNGVSVNAEIPVGSLPAGTTLDVAGVNDIASFQHVCDELNFPGHILTAVDISFMSNGEEVEPRRPVTITMSSDALINAENVQIIHFPCDANGIANMDGRPEVITDYYLSGNTISFDADQFSVYAVSGGSSSGGNLLTVEFYAKDTSGTWQKINAQAIRMSKIASMDAPVFDPGVPTITTGQSFEGWAETQAEAESDDTVGISVAEINSEIKNSGYDANTASKTLKFYAMVFNVRYVVYHDQAGAVLMTQAYHVHGNNPESVKIDWSYVGFKGGQNFAGWVEESAIATNTQGDLLLGDYPLYKDNVGQVYENGESYNLSETLQLYPYLNTGNWLVFDNYIDRDDDPTSASYTSPVFYADGENTAAPATPTRTGYEFKGWYRDKQFNERFIFGSPINEDTTVYAKWEAKQTTYQVVFWQQNPTDAVDAADADKTYSFYKVEERGALTGSSVSLNLADSGTAADNRRGGNSTTSIGEMGFFFTYNGTNSDTGSVVVKGDGSTVLNVYYDRKVITYNFYGDLTSYSYSSSTYNSNYAYYGYSNGSYFRVTRSSGYWYNASGTRYTGTVYHLTFTQGTSTVSSAEVQFGSIQGLWFSTMESFDWAANTNISGNDWPYCGRYLMWHDENTGRYQNKAFQYETGSDLVVEKNFFLNEYAVSSTTRPYTCLGQDTDGNYTITLDDDALKSNETVYFNGTEYYGYTLSRYSLSSSNYNSATAWDGKELGVSYSDIGSNGHAYFFYSRNAWDFVYESNNTTVKTETRYWEASLSDLSSYVPTNGPLGCYFDGWYADPAFDTEFDFSQEMPNHNVMIYAKWTMMRFRVVLDPTGQEAGVSPSDITFPGNQATTFRVDYGELVQASSINNAQRDGYTLLGWFTDPEFKHPFNFGTPITDEIADMSYATASAAERSGSDPWNIDSDTGLPKTYNDADGEHDDVRGKVTIYAHWRKNPDGIIGINVHYDATDKDGNTGKFSDNTTEWNDPNIYADKAKAFGQPASTPDDSDLQFLYWEILDANNNNAVVGKAYPGQLWEINVDWAKVTDLTAKAVYYTYGDKKTAEGKVTGSSTRSGADALEATTLTTTVFSDNFDEGTAFTTSTSSSDTMSTEYWTAYNTGYGNNWSNATTAPYSGSYSAVYQYSSSYAANCYLISKPFKVDSSASDLTVSFYQRAGSSSYSETYEVFLIVTDGVTTNGTAVNATHYNVFTSASYNNTTYTLRSGSPNNLSALKGKNVRLVIHCTSAADRAYLLIDDVTVTQTKTGETVTYELVNTPEAGKDYVIVVGDTHAVTNSVYSNNRYINATSVVNNGDGTITFFADEESSLLYRVGGSASGWTFYNQAAGKYLGLNASDSHYLSMTSAAWEWLYTGTDLDNQWTGSDNVNSNGDAWRYLGYSATYDDFTTMISTGQNVKFYRAVNTDYTVTFVDGHTNEVIETQQVAEGESAVAPEAPDHSDEGYIFTGWDTDYSMVTENIIVTAEYVNQSSLSYTVTFRYMDSNGDWTSSSQTVQHGNAANPPDAASVAPAGYTFNSWDKKYDNITSNLTINAVYKQTATKKYEITLRAVYGRANTTAKTHIYWFANNDVNGVNGGDVQRDLELGINEAINIPTPSNFRIYTGSKAGENTLTYEDHIFLGWARIDNETGTNPEGVAHPELNEDDLFLKWHPDTQTYTVEKKINNIDDVAIGSTVSQVAADETHPYHDMYAVWATVFYVYHSGGNGEGNTVEKVVMTNTKFVDGVRVPNKYDIAHATADGFLYGGYYKAYEGTSTGWVSAKESITWTASKNQASWNSDGTLNYDAMMETKTDADATAYTGGNVTWNIGDAYLVTRDGENAENGLAMTPKAGTTYYLKEVPADKYLRPYLHYTYRLPGDGVTDDITAAWLISDLDDLNYYEGGFVIIHADHEATVVNSLTIQNTNGNNSIKLTAKRVFGAKGYISYLKVISEMNDQNALLTAGDRVMQYWVTPDGLLVTGTAAREYTGLGFHSTIGYGSNIDITSIIEVYDASTPTPWDE